MMSYWPRTFVARERAVPSTEPTPELPGPPGLVNTVPFSALPSAARTLLRASVMVWPSGAL